MARYALLIGITDYNTPFQYLDKAIDDADAVGKKLGTENKYTVTKLANPNGDDLYKELKAFLQVQAKEAEALIYFTGHGFQTISSRSGEITYYLAASDCTVTKNKDDQIVEQQKGLSFKELNGLIQDAKCSSLVVLLDACHSGGFVENNSLNEPIDKSLSSFQARNDYYFITACRSHQKAETKKRSTHSVFTQALLDGLDRKNSDSNGRITSDRLFDVINTELEARQQEPLRMGKGRAIIVIEYEPIYLKSPSGIISSEEIERLLEILKLQNISKIIQPVYKECLPSFWEGPTSSDLKAILNQLNEEVRREAGKSPPLFEFIGRLTDNSEIPELVEAELKKWMANVAQVYGIKLVPLQSSTPPKVTPYLLIRLKPSKYEKNCFFIKAWFFLEADKDAEYSQFRPLSNQEYLEEQSCSFQDVPKLLNHFIDQTFNELQNIKNYERPIIEFFLPRDYLCTTVDQLTVLGAIEEEFRLGTEYQVVVRSYERLTRRYRNMTRIPWSEKWNQAKELTPPFPENLFKLLSTVDELNPKDKDKWDSLRASLADKIGLKLTCCPLQSQSTTVNSTTNKQDWIGALLSTATPIAIWPRCPVSDETTFSNAIDELFDSGSLSELPEYVRQKRIDAVKEEDEAHIGHHLVLLWEDPNRLPPDEEAFEHKTAKENS